MNIIPQIGQFLFSKVDNGEAGHKEFVEFLSSPKAHWEVSQKSSPIMKPLSASDFPTTWKTDLERINNSKPDVNADGLADRFELIDGDKTFSLNLLRGEQKKVTIECNGKTRAEYREEVSAPDQLVSLPKNIGWERVVLPTSLEFVNGALILHGLEGTSDVFRRVTHEQWIITFTTPKKEPVIEIKR